MSALRRVVFDTSSLVGAALLIDSTPHRALAHALAADEVCASAETLAELKKVLLRPKFDRYQLREVRAIVGDVPFLVPGVGAQGGDVEAVVTNAKTAEGTGLMVSSSRAILYASSGEGFAEAAASAAKALRDEVNRHR